MAGHMIHLEVISFLIYLISAKLKKKKTIFQINCKIRFWINFKSSFILGNGGSYNPPGGNFFFNLLNISKILEKNTIFQINCKIRFCINFKTSFILGNGGSYNPPGGNFFLIYLISAKF